MMHFGFTSFSFWGWFMMVFWWTLIIVGIMALIKWMTGEFGNARDDKKTPIDILKERYAKGEIDKKEFEEKIREIKSV